MPKLVPLTPGVSRVLYDGGDGGDQTPPLFVTALETCGGAARPRDVRPEAVAGRLSRQLFVGAEDVAIKAGDTADAGDGLLVHSYGASATVDGRPLTFEVYTVSSSRCTRDVVFWSPEASGLSPVRAVSRRTAAAGLLREALPGGAGSPGTGPSLGRAR